MVDPAGGSSLEAGSPNSSAKCSKPAGEANTSTRVGSTSTVNVCGMPFGARTNAPEVASRDVSDVERHLAVEHIPGLVLAMMDVKRGFCRLEGKRFSQREAPSASASLTFNVNRAPSDHTDSAVCPCRGPRNR
jgi:hypothetical protein